MAQFHTVSIGHAIVDILAQIDDSFLQQHEVAKGSMTLIEEHVATALYQSMPQTREVSGGSAANTAAAIASLGGKSAFIGKVKNDQFGKVFTHDLQATGVHFSAITAENGDPTACSYVLVTPDADRTMCTYLGVAGSITASDIEADLIKNADVTYLEGYLWDSPSAKEAFYHAITIAKDAGKQVATTLSDAFCVDRHKAVFKGLIEDEQTDILFGNEEEIKSLCETEDFAEAVKLMQQYPVISVLTRGAQGAVLIHNSKVTELPAQPVDNVVDTTGAGDSFAAGFLYGYTQGQALEECVVLGNKIAGGIIQHIGARSPYPLS